MKIAFVVILYSILFLIDGYPILKGYKSGKTLPYITIFLVALVLNLLIALKIKIPSPANGIEKIIMIIIGK